MALVYVLLGAHFVGDFVCQTDKMALNKSKSWIALWNHVCAYMFVVMLSLGFVYGFRTDLPWLGAFMFANFAAHFAQDAITSRITSRLWFLEPFKTYEDPRYALVFNNGRRHWFFVAIGADQLAHYVTLLATAQWWLL